jgi:hypothetical protein
MRDLDFRVDGSGTVPSRIQEQPTRNVSATASHLGVDMMASEQLRINRLWSFRGGATKTDGLVNHRNVGIEMSIANGSTDMSGTGNPRSDECEPTES